MMCAFKMHKRPLMSGSYLQSEVDGAGSGPGGLMRGVLFFVVWLVGCAAALAEPCAGNPGALGTSRVLTVSPTPAIRSARIARIIRMLFSGCRWRASSSKSMAE
jgi:hypothetical protein